jgi:two-component system CheB/CheR fusion protein
VLVRAVLAPYADMTATGGDARATIAGPKVPIGGDAVTSLALVLHELATNAAKYGAFSTPDGQVRVSWIMTKKKLELQWQERGGPAVHRPPAREGFGSMLARRSTHGQLDGELAFDWQTEGLTVHFSAAAERLSP